MTQEHRLHTITLAVQRIDDPIYKCEPANRRLFTNIVEGPPDWDHWVLLQEGTSGSMEIEASPSDMPRGDKRTDAQSTMDAEECTRLPIL
jgi:hypothetical protein